MQPSQVRLRILEDHARLRIVLSELDEVAGRVVGGEVLLAFRLRVLAEAMREGFLEHLDLEDDVLVPVVRAIVPSGSERAAQITLDHRAQRDRFQGLLLDLRDERRPSRELAHELRQLVRDLRREMEEEEATILDEDLLRDEAVPIGEETG